jgi:hypothetical protein
VTATAAVIADPNRQPITVQRNRDGGVFIRRPPNLSLVLSKDETDRLVTFIENRPTIQRFPAPRSTESDQK